jgi:uncharacterized protein (UPF0333 family)
MFKNLHRKKKGQSTLEYIIMVTGVVVVLILFLGPNGIFRTAYNQTLGQGTNGMEDMANRLRNSRAAAQ